MGKVYITKERIEGTRDDGRTYLIHPAGTKLSYTEARELGLIGQQQEEPEEVDATNGARKLAEQEGVSLSQINGSGPGGRIYKKDVQEALS